MLTETGDGDMTRALLTPGERDAVRDDPEMDAGTKASHLSRVRGKLDQLQEDARLLREYREEIYEEAREAFVEDELDDRMKRLEEKLEQRDNRVDQLEDQVENLRADISEEDNEDG